MKICTKCGKNYSDDVDFCINCGVKLAGLPTQENEVYEPEEDEELKIADNNNKILIDNDEKIFAELGTGYIKNIITSGNITAAKAILTQKRLYLSGKTYIISKNALTMLNESKIINIEDITGTGFVYFSNAMFIAIAAILLMAGIFIYDYVYEPTLPIIMFIASALFLAGFFINRKSLFKIEYSGGSICFDVKWLNANESVNFQKKIFQVKDKRKKEIIQESLKEK